jgi:ABC-type dipeptide/oligopeptide/nickel transport system permease component/ABC-type transport system substrate-binding protein
MVGGMSCGRWSVVNVGRLLARGLGWLAAGMIFVVGLFYLLALGFRTDVSTPPEPRDPEDVALAQAAREPRLNLESPPVFPVAVDYGAGPAAAWWPRGESPVLAELVAEGRLPPVAERVGPQPLVLRGVEGIGRYGGTWHRVASSDSDVGIISWRLAAPTLLRWSPEGYPLVPNLATSWEILNGGREYIVHLRQGVRWSDGHPFTAHDIMYWWRYEIRHFNSEPLWMSPRGVLGEITLIDDHTLRFSFESPHGLFLEELAMAEIAFPAHYLGQFHPALAEPGMMNDLMQALQVSNPLAVYNRMKDLFNPDFPRLWPWVYRSYTANPPHVFVRNPYYWAVDEAGNQLPYLDRVAFQVRGSNMIGLAATQGSITFQLRHLRYDDYTLLMSERDRGDYEVYHWFQATRSTFTLFPNMTRRVDPADPATAHKRDLLGRKEFRQALSLAINRAEIIQAEFNNQVEPAQIDPGPDSPFHNPALFKAYTDYDPARANTKLDGLGLTRRDREGFRTLADGSRMVFYIHATDYTGSGPVQLIIDDWAAVGVRAVLKEQARTLFQAQQTGLEHDFTVWTGESEFMPMVGSGSRNFVPTALHSFFAPAYGVWFLNGGLYGNPRANVPGAEAPPPDHPLRRVMEVFEAAMAETDSAEQRRIFHEVLEIAAENLWTINIATPPPQPVVVKRGLRNVPPVAIVGALPRTPTNAGIETWWLEDPRESPGMRANLKREMIETLPNPGLRRAGAATAAPAARDWTATLLRWLLTGILVVGAILISFRHPYVGRRLLIMVPTLLVISIITFTIIQMPPGDFLTSRIQELEMTGDEAAVLEVKNLRTLFHLEEHVVVRYFRWLGLPWFLSFDSSDAGLLQGNLGRSMETGRLVNEIVGDRILLTVAISLSTILFTWAFALPTGIYSAVRQYSVGDYVLTFLGFIGMCVPNFLLALVMIYLAREWFGIQVTGLFSEHYALQPEWTWGKFVNLLQHIWIPVVVLGVGGTAGMIRVMRGNLLDELRKPYVTTARAKGVRPLKLLLKYPVRLALNPFISGIGGIFPQLVSGGAIVAMVLALPTVGPLMLSALMTQDMYLAGSMLMVLSALGVFGTLVSDLLLLWLDPRIRLEGGAK